MGIPITTTPEATTTPEVIIDSEDVGAWWPLEEELIEPSGDTIASTPAPVTVEDIIGSNDGTFYNPSFSSGGKVNNCALFDGSSKYISVPHDPSINPTPIMSYEMWVQISDPNKAGWQWIAEKGNSSIYSFQIVYNGSGYLRLGVGINNNSSVSADIHDTFIPNTWYHIAFTYDGTFLKAYLNGNLVATRSGTGTINNVNAPLYFGTNPNIGSYFGGLIDEPAIYNVALTQAQIQAIYNAGSAGKTGLIG